MDNRKHVFTPIEKKYFLEIIKKYKSIVENKNTDSTSLRNKNVAWNKIAAEYNSSPHASSQATNKQLRRLWLNLKQRQRAMMKERQQRLAAGAISEAMDHETKVAPTLILGIDSAIDSNTILEITNHNHVKPKIERTHLESSEITDHDYQASETVVPVSLCHVVDEMSQRPTVNQRHNKRDSILEREYKDSETRANEKHEMEMKILYEQFREARAKAELAELILRQKRQI